jgi:hypothetical protein
MPGYIIAGEPVVEGKPLTSAQVIAIGNLPKENLALFPGWLKAQYNLQKSGADNQQPLSSLGARGGLGESTVTVPRTSGNNDRELTPAEITDLYQSTASKTLDDISFGYPAGVGSDEYPHWLKIQIASRASRARRAASRDLDTRMAQENFRAGATTENQLQLFAQGVARSTGQKFTPELKPANWSSQGKLNLGDRTSFATITES